MKKHLIFITIAAISSIVVLGIPQLTGTVFVNNEKEKQPVDWLSAQILKFRKENKEMRHEIPAHIRHIKIGGAKNHGHIYVRQDSIQHIRYQRHNDYVKAEITIDKDTLIIANGASLPYLSLNIDRNITKLIFNNAKNTKVHINQTLPLDISITNQSDIYMRGNRNRNLDKISVTGMSTFTLSHCFTPVIDMQIDNSMVYIDLFNNIDSLKAHLIGKSNIKLSGTPLIDNDANLLMKEFDVTKYSANIYPTGDLSYYKVGN